MRKKTSFGFYYLFLSYTAAQTKLSLLGINGEILQFPDSAQKNEEMINVYGGSLMGEHRR